MAIKYSIIIPTKDHLEDCLKPCCEAIKKYCKLEDKEIFIVANGCKDGTKAYVESLGEPFKLLWFDEALGFSKANNEAIRLSKGEFILFLNNDAFFTEQEKDTAINVLASKFENPRVMIVGPQIRNNMETDRDFVIFYCTMVRKKLFDEIGLLDEAFADGTCEDVDFCIKAVNAGYFLAAVPIPVHHLGGTTIVEMPDMMAKLNRNAMLLGKRYNSRWYKEQMANSQLRFGNNFERAVISKKDDLSRFPREYARYKWVSDRIWNGAKVLEIGCSTGFGVQLFPKDIDYTGIDYDIDIIEFAKENFGDKSHKFIVTDVNKFDYEQYDVIIAFEILEHLDNGRELAQKLKDHCKHLFATAPYGEIPGLWGPHHKLHRLKEIDFQGFDYSFLSYDGRVIKVPERIDGHNLLLLEWEKGKVYKKIAPRPTILCAISTKNRYDILPLAIQSICSQTVTPDKLVIFDDGEHKDVREVDTYSYLFKLLDDRFIKWEVVFSSGKGQHHNHQASNKMGFDLVWRLDDDELYCVEKFNC